MKRTARRPPRSRTKPSADREQVVRRLRAIRRLAHALRRDTTAPAVERVSQIIETECHLALWALGEVRGMIPEAEPRA
jgi:hypothetical protein